jgi:coenzyme Q-binding protein COQ10
MISFKTNREIHFTTKQIFDLIMDIEKYPEFLPWINGARIINRNDNEIVAELDIYFKGYKTSYISNVVSRNDNDVYSISIKSMNGPFKRLENLYTLYPIENNSCQINFDNIIEFRFKIIEDLIGLKLSSHVEKIISAFEIRAKNIYLK